MLDEETRASYLFFASEKFIKMYDDLIQYALNDIAERIMKNDVLTPTAQYRVWKLQQIGLHIKKIKEYIASKTGKSDKEVDLIFSEYGHRYYRADVNVSIKYGQHKTMNIQTSKFMKDVMSYYVVKTKNEIKRLNAVTAVFGRNLLSTKLDQLHFRVATGVQSYQQAINTAINDLCKEQVYVNRTINFRQTMESAIRRTIVTGVNKCYADLNLVRAKEDNYDHVLVSSHLGARHVENPIPEYLSHDIWQGKVYKVNYSNVSIISTKGVLNA